MSNWLGKIGYTVIVACAAFALLQSPLDQRSFGTVPVSTSALIAGPGEFQGPGGGNFQVVSTLLPTGYQQIVVVDTQAQTMAAYHIEPNQGKIQLKSVRRLAWDLKMEQFNAESPLPSELRAVQP